MKIHNLLQLYLCILSEQETVCDDERKIMQCQCMSFSDTVDEDDDLYDFVEDEDNEGDDIYEDLMKRDEQSENVSHSSGIFNFFYWIKIDERFLKVCSFFLIINISDHL